MKKVIAILAALLMAAPVMATVTITATQVGDTNEVEIGYSYTGTTDNDRPRSFALDITVDSDNVIKSVVPKFVGECTTTEGGYGIFMGSITFNADGTVKSNGTPVCDPAEQLNTLPGLNSSGATIEMASLYDTNASVVVTKPGNPGKLCSIFVNPINQTKLFIRTNVGRSGVVLQNGNSSEDSGTTKVATNLPPVINPYNITLNFPTGCKGDFDGGEGKDGKVDASDMNTLMMYLFINGDSENGWLCPAPFPADFDLDGSGTLDASDMNELMMFLFTYGNPDEGWVCPICMP